MQPEHLQLMQDVVQTESMKDPELFWMRHASHLCWHRQPERAISFSTRTLPSGTSHPTWSYFPGGQISTSYNCIDRHVEAGHGNKPAIIYDSPVTNSTQKITYTELLKEVELLAAALYDDLNVRKGDTVLIYMPMLPQALYAMLATSRLGAIHAVVFGGFAANSLAQRIDAARPKTILTASCGLEGYEKILNYRGFVEDALALASHKPSSILILDRRHQRWGNLDRQYGQMDWESLINKKIQQNRYEKGVAIGSEEALYIIYTSGTTGVPKGVLRPAGGHAVGLHLSIHYTFGLKGPGDVMFCASDIGWVVGHSYIVYAPLLAGATTILFEGKPIGTPDAGSFWRILEEHNVGTLFTAPTALRAIRREDPEHKFFRARGEKGGLRGLRSLFLAGERSEPNIVSAYRGLLVRYCARNAQVVDNWWSSESGSPITSIAMRPGVGVNMSNNQSHRAWRIKPGAAGKPMPGFDVRCVDDDGREVPNGTMGNVVLGLPLGPTAFITLFQDDERFYRSYLERFNSRWIDTGDAGVIDQDGFVSIMSRADDVINVAAHRFSTGSIEQAITSHPEVAEGCVVGVPDELKGHLPFAFITLNVANHPGSAIPDERLFQEINQRVRDQIGGIASLGGMIQGKGMIPKTRSGKTLRRVLRQLVENAVYGDFDKEVNVPATVEDRTFVDVARAKVREYFQKTGSGKHRAIEVRPKI